MNVHAFPWLISYNNSHLYNFVNIFIRTRIYTSDYAVCNKLYNYEKFKQSKRLDVIFRIDYIKRKLTITSHEGWL